MRLFIVIALVLIALGTIAAFAFVRLAPTDPDTWHRLPDRVGSSDGPIETPTGFSTVVARADGAEAALEALDRVALATPRTRRVAGDPASGMITYVTRSALWGFPDYTTVSAEQANGGSTLRLFARSRFGGFDHGVNKARIEDWLARLDG